MDALAFLSCFGMDAGIAGLEFAYSNRGVSDCHDLLHAQARAVILERVMQRLKEDEGAVKLGGRHLVYKDSLGLETVGYDGCCLAVCLRMRPSICLRATPRNLNG